MSESIGFKKQRTLCPRCGRMVSRNEDATLHAHKCQHRVQCIAPRGPNNGNVSVADPCRACSVLAEQRVSS